MDVLPNEEEQMLRTAVRDFLEAECPTSLVREMEKDDLGYPPELWEKMAELEWLGMSLPEEHGGQRRLSTHRRETEWHVSGPRCSEQRGRHLAFRRRRFGERAGERREARRGRV